MKVVKKQEIERVRLDIGIKVFAKGLLVLVTLSGLVKIC